MCAADIHRGPSSVNKIKMHTKVMLANKNTLEAGKTKWQRWRQEITPKLNQPLTGVAACPLIGLPACYLAVEAAYLPGSRQ